MLPPSLTNFKIQKKYKNEPKFNGSHSRNNLSKIIDEAYIINLDKHESIGTHWITLYVNTENIIFLDSFGENKFAYSNKLLPFYTKSINPI